MNLRLKIFISAAILLLAANIVKWTVFNSGNITKAGGDYDVSRLVINYQRPGGKEQVKMIRDLFDGQEPGYNTEFKAREQKNVAAALTVSAVPEEKWPEFRISGVAINEGKKCAFFSGPAFSGAVYEGSIITDKYTLAAISDGSAEIINNVTGEKRNYSLEGK